MKRPGVASTTAGVDGDGDVDGEGEGGEDATGGRWDSASILGDVKRSNEARKRTLEVSGGRPGAEG